MCICSCRAKARHATYTGRSMQLKKKKIRVAKIIKILLIIGMAIFAYTIGEIAWRYIDKDYANKLKVEIWNSRIAEFEKEQSEKARAKKVNKDEIYHDKKFDSSIKCLLNQKEIVFPKIREEIGDTINIKNVYDWQLSFVRTDEDKELSKIINRGRKFFQIDQSENSIQIGFLEDEGEYLGIYLYSIAKKNCEIIGKELLAETTAWENGYKETFSIIKDDNRITREKKTGAKDWGDGTKWIRDTIKTMMTFDEMGKINLE